MTLTSGGPRRMAASAGDHEGGDPTESVQADHSVVRHGAVTAVVCLALAAVTAAMSSLTVACPTSPARPTRPRPSSPGSSTPIRWCSLRCCYPRAPWATATVAAGPCSWPEHLRRRLDRRHDGLLTRHVDRAAWRDRPRRSADHAGHPVDHHRDVPAGPAGESSQHLAGVAGAAAVVGVLISGALLDFFSWQAVFAVNIVLAGIALVGTIRIVPESANPNAPRLDLAGAGLSIVGLVALVYSIIEAPTAGWLSARTLGGIALGLAVLAVFVTVELHRDAPMLDPRIFRRRRLSAGTVSIFAQFFGFYGFIFLILQYLQIVRRDSALIAAVSMLPMAATMMPTSRLAPKLAGRFGSRRVCVAGLTLIAVAFAVIAQVGRDTDYWVLAVGLLVLGVGMGAAMTPATSAITAALPKAQQGVASAMNDLAREVGGALGIAVLGSVMAAVYRAHLVVTDLPAQVASKARDSFAVATHLGGPVARSADTAFVDASTPPSTSPPAQPSSPPSPSRPCSPATAPSKTTAPPSRRNDRATRKDTDMNVREAFFEVLRSHGITTIFGNPGSNELPLLRDFPDDFRYILALHEGAAIGMADGYAQATGRPALVNLHAAAGTGNAMGNLTNTQSGHVPVVVTAGQQARRYTALNAMLTNVDAPTLPEPLVKWSYEPPRPRDVPHALSRAILLAASAPAGPVYLSLPLDDWDYDADVSALDHLKVRAVHGDPVVGEPSLDLLRRRLLAAKNPLLVLGPGVDDATGWDGAVRLAENLALPVFVAPSPSRCPFPTRHPGYRGVLPSDIPGLARHFEGHDLVVVFGAAIFRYHEFQDGDYLPSGVELWGRHV